MDTLIGYVAVDRTTKGGQDTKMMPFADFPASSDARLQASPK